MKEGAKRHPPMFYTFDFFSLLDPLSYEHRRDGENPCLVVPILWKHGYSKHSLTALRMKSHFVVWMVIKLHLVHIMSVDFIDEVSQALTHAPLGPTEKEFLCILTMRQTSCAKQSQHLFKTSTWNIWTTD